MEELEELKKICEPVIAYLQNKKHPYYTIIISETEIKLLETVIRANACK